MNQANRVFEPSILLDMLGEADNETLIDFFTIYLQHTSNTWLEIHNYVNANDWHSVSSLAHSLKSSSRSIGAIQFGDLMEQLEKTTKEGVAAPELVERGSLSLNKTRDAIQQHMTNLKSYK